MKAIVVRPPNVGAEVKEIDLHEPLLPGGVRVRTLYTGICGTDRGIVTGKITFARPPDNSGELILGHEGLGVVEEVAEGVTRLKKGDLVVPIVRRGCGVCLNCKIGRQDFCETGNFVEAGIRGLHGFMREEFVDSVSYLVKVPKEIADVAVLTEPLSNVVKAIDQVMEIQKRTVWTCGDSSYECRNAFVVGTGPIGTFFSLLLTTYGFNVYMLNRRDPSPAESEIAETIDATFYNTSKGYLGLPRADIVVDTSGYPSAFMPLLSRMNKNGILVLFGTSSNDSAKVDAEMVTSIVENNIAVIGSVNASKEHFVEAVNYLTMWKERYGTLLSKMITSVVSPEQAIEALTRKSSGEIKTVIKWS